MFGIFKRGKKEDVLSWAESYFRFKLDKSRDKNVLEKQIFTLCRKFFGSSLTSFMIYESNSSECLLYIKTVNILSSKIDRFEDCLFSVFFDINFSVGYVESREKNI